MLVTARATSAQNKSCHGTVSSLPELSGFASAFRTLNELVELSVVSVCEVPNYQ